MSEENEDQEEQHEEEIDQEIVDRAVKMGWSPKDQWRGDPEDWIDADEFIERGENVIPILKERTQHALSKNEQLQREITDMKKQHQELVKRLTDRDRKAIKDRQAKAVAEADEEAFKQADKELEDLEKSTPKDDPDSDPVFTSWLSSNPWYTGEDFEIIDYAHRYGEFLQGKYQGQAFLDKVSEAVKKKFPDRFENQRRSNPSPEGGKRRGSKPKGPSYESLPPEAKVKCDEYVADGLLTVDEYVEAYFEGGES